jgi:hypothetical protein
MQGRREKLLTTVNTSSRQGDAREKPWTAVPTSSTTKLISREMQGRRDKP